MDRKLIAQEYYTLAVDENGYMPLMRKEETNTGLAAAAFMDLLIDGVVTVEKKRITADKHILTRLSPIESLYSYLYEKPRTTDKMMIDYYASSRMKQLSADVGKSLAAEGAAAEGRGSVFGPKTVYIPEQSYKKELVDEIKNAAAGKNEVSLHDGTLIFLLDKTKNLNQYFSKFEKTEWKGRLKE